MPRKGVYFRFFFRALRSRFRAALVFARAFCSGEGGEGGGGGPYHVTMPPMPRPAMFTLDMAVTASCS